MKESLKGTISSAQSVRGKLLMLVLPIVIIGLVVMCSVSFYMMSSAFEKEIISNAEKNVSEVSSGVSAWLDARKLETHITANTQEVRNFPASETDLRTFTKTRYDLMGKVFPGMYDSVSWGPFDGSGNLYGENKKGYIEMHNKDKAWYKDTMTGQKESFMAPPVISQSTGRMIVNSIAVGKNNSGANAVMILAAIYVDAVTEKVGNVKLTEGGYSYMISQTGAYIVTPNPDDLMKKKMSEEENPGLQELAKRMAAGEQGHFEFKDDNGQDVIAFYNPVESTGWSMATIAVKNELFAPVGNTLKVMSFIAFVVLLMITGGIVFAVNRIMSPLGKMMTEVSELANGDFRDRNCVVDTNDELGALSKAMDDMRSKIRELLNNVNNSAQSLAESADQLNSTSSQSALASQQVANSIIKVAEGSAEQLNAVNNTTATIEALNSNIQRIANDAMRIASDGRIAADVAREGGKKLDLAINQMRSIENSTVASTEVVTALGERSEEIEQIVATISSIADQTNLLALNAAIEAARAGEQGRGFAVVAEEVRKLAASSQEATQQISELISVIRQETSTAVERMQNGSKEVGVGAANIMEMGESFRNIIDIVEKVSNKIQSISNDIDNMANDGNRIVDNVKVIEDASRRTAEESETVSAATEEQTASVDEIANSSNNLSVMANDLQNDVHRFKL